MVLHVGCPKLPYTSALVAVVFQNGDRVHSCSGFRHESDRAFNYSINWEPVPLTAGITDLLGGAATPNPVTAGIT